MVVIAAQNFEIEPDERDHQAEGAVPLHVFWSAHAHASFDHVEVEDQIERGDDHHEETETDTPGTAAVENADVDAEEAQDHSDKVEDGDAAGGGDHAELEALCGANNAGLVRHQHDQERAEGQAHGFDGDAMIRGLENCGDAA